MEESERFGTWCVEITASREGFEVTRRTAAMLAQRIGEGSAIIVTSKPRATHAVMMKRWKRVLRLVENQKAASLGNARRELKDFEQRLAATPFLVSQPEETVVPSVFLLEPDDLGFMPPSVATLFVLTPLSMPQLAFWGRRLPDEAKMVVFRRGAFPAPPEVAK